MNRRRFLMNTGKTAAITAVAASLAQRLAAADQAAPGTRIRHSVCKWCYPKIPLDDLCVAGKEFGLESVELLTPDDFATLRKHDMTCAIVAAPSAETATGVRVGGIEKAFNRIEHHDTLAELYEAHLKRCAEVGANQLICFSGNREGMSDDQDLENCAIGIRRIIPTAEKLGITVAMELLNSKVNHADYQCDRTHWGVELCKRVGSDRFKLLYDIYHMQIMEGDVISTIRASHDRISHYHTGGVPGRNEIDETQELYYPAIMRAIVDTGYKGFVGQEFVPKRPDPIASLRQGVEICSV